VERSFRRAAFLVTGSLLAWLACFAAIYVSETIACARGFARAQLAPGIGPIGAAATVLLLATAIFTARQVHRALHQRRRGDQNAKFLQFLALSLGMLMLTGLAMLALPALLVRPACAAQPTLVSSAGSAPQYARSYTTRYQ
jgi:hypothetical protein